MTKQKGKVGIRRFKPSRPLKRIEDVCEFFETDFCDFRVQVTTDMIHFNNYCKGFYQPCTRHEFAVKRKRDYQTEQDMYEVDTNE